MSSQTFDFQDLLQLVELVKSTSQFNEFKLRANGIELELRRGAADSAGFAAGANSAHPAAPAPLLPVPTSASTNSTPTASVLPATRTALGVELLREDPASRPPAPAAAPVADEGHAIVTAPMVGTVYLAPGPGARPFVTIGQEVDANTQVCIVEVMKLMNAIPAGTAGVVTKILVSDTDTVEYGQPLVIITPR